MSLREYIKSLNGEQLDAYAADCGTSAVYIKTHLLSARKIPKNNLLHALSEKSNGKVSALDVLTHFGLLKPAANTLQTNNSDTACR